MKKSEDDSKPIKPIRIKKRTESLSREIKQLEGRIERLEEMKERMSEFIFQSVSITVGMFAMVLTLIVGFSTRWNFGDFGSGLVVLLLAFIFILNLIWYAQWYENQKKK